MTALTEDGRPGGTFLIFFGGVSERGKKERRGKNKKATVTNVYETKQSQLNSVGFLQCFRSEQGVSRAPHTH